MARIYIPLLRHAYIIDVKWPKLTAQPVLKAFFHPTLFVRVCNILSYNDCTTVCMALYHIVGSVDDYHKPTIYNT